MDQFNDLPAKFNSATLSSEISSIYSDNEITGSFHDPIFYRDSQNEADTDIQEEPEIEIKNIDVHSLDNMLFDNEETLISFQDIPLIVDQEHLHDLLTDNLIDGQFNKQTPTLDDSIIIKNELEEINKSLNIYKKKTNYGLHTCFTISDPLLAIGTTRGFIIILNTQSCSIVNVLILPKKVADSCSSVICLSISRHLKYILAAYSDGLVVTWDMNANSAPMPYLLKFPKLCPLIQLKFSSDPKIAYAVTSDYEGYLITIDKNGSEVTCTSFLKPNPNVLPIIYPCILPKNWIRTVLARDYVLAALTSVKKIYIISAKPERKILQTFDIVENHSRNIQISWSASSDVQLEQAMHLKFACSHSGLIQIYQAFCYDRMILDKIVFQATHSIISENMLHFGWYTTYSFYALSLDETFKLLDCQTGVTFESISVRHENIAITNPKSPKKLPKIIATAYQKSILYNKGSIFYLSSDRIQSLTLRSWNDRLNYLFENFQYLTILKLFCDIDNGYSALVLETELTNLMFEETVKNAIQSYINHKFQLNLPSTSDNGFLVHYSKFVLTPLMYYCSNMHQNIFLFESCYEYLAPLDFARDAFLDCLVPLILNNKIKIIPYPILLQFKDRIAYSNNKPKIFEECLLKIDIHLIDGNEFDINPLLECCWNEKLYDGLFYIYNICLKDCITPLKNLISLLAVELTNIDAKNASIVNDLGNSIFRNIHQFLMDTSLPLSTFLQVFKVFLTKFEVGDLEKISWKYMRTILKFNLKDFVNILTITFDFYCHRDISPEALNMIDRKRRTLILVILQILLADSSISPKEISVFFIFMARQITLKPKRIILNRIVLEQILQYLTYPDLNNSLEKQQALIELLQSGVLEEINLDYIVSMASSVHFHNVCEYAYEKQRKFDTLLKYCCYNSNKPANVFDVISRIVMDIASEQESYDVVESTFNSLLERLAEIDCCKTAELLYQIFPAVLKTVISRFENKDKLKFNLFKHLFNYGFTTTYSKKVYEEFISDTSTYEEYIRLMCIYAPSDVAEFLLKNSTYRLSIVFGMLNQHNLHYPKGIIYEKMDNFKQAGNSYIDFIRFCINNLRENYNKKKSTEESLNTVKTMFNKILEFFTRVFNKINKKELEEMWFSLIDALIDSLVFSEKDDQLELTNLLRNLGNVAFSEMSKQLPIHDVINKVMVDAKINGLPFGDVKSMFYLMSENNNFDKTCSKALVNILSNECYYHLLEREQVIRRGVALQHSNCGLCDISYAFQDTHQFRDEEIIIFWCQHSFHHRCIINFFRFSQTNTCPKCQKVDRSIKPNTNSSHGKNLQRLNSLEKFRNFDKINKYFGENQKSLKDLYNSISELSSENNPSRH